MNVQLHFVREGVSLEVAAGTDLLQAQRLAGLQPDAPCGGQGTCGKCLVDIRSTCDDVWQRVKSCAAKAFCDLQIRTLSHGETEVLTQGAELQAPWNPWVEAISLRVPPCAIGECGADWTRLTLALEAATGRGGWRLSMPLVRRLGALLPRTQGKIWAVVSGTRILDLWEQPKPVYMAAFDLGTTTLAGYLIGQAGTLARAGVPNPQAQFGADVIGRADYAMQHGVGEPAQCAREAIDGLLGRLCDRAGISREEVLAVSLVGNTCMHHLFLGICPISLARAPYNPALSDGAVLSCGDYGIHAHNAAPLLVLPVIAGFVGADTVGCLVAGNWKNREKLTLLIDIGTNGEIVLGNQHRMMACSTAAGPALEGALISSGMRGAPGAVDHVWIENGKIRHSVIGGGPAKGICGSGLIDLIAVLRETGQMDESGALQSGPSIGLPGTDLLLTQKDIRQVQLAKAAISAGIRLLARRWGVSLEEIDEVHIAGAFGTFMNADSACGIGLIPPALRQKIRSVGNAAGEGARLVLQDRQLWDTAQSLARKAEFLELAAVPDFQDTFIDELDFPAL